MQALKMTISTVSLLMLIVCFTTAAPMVQQKEKTPSAEVIPLPTKPDKKLNFIQKFILKKVQKKMKKVSDEDEYRKQVRLSVIFGVLAATPILGFFFMIISVIKGVEALKSQDKRTRRLAISGIVFAVLLPLVWIGLIIHVANTIPSSFCFAGC